MGKQTVQTCETCERWRRGELDNKALRMKKGRRDRPQRGGTVHFQLRGASAWLITLHFNTKLTVKGKRGKGRMIIIWSWVCTVPPGGSGVYNIETTKKIKAVLICTRVKTAYIQPWGSQQCKLVTTKRTSVRYNEDEKAKQVTLGEKMAWMHRGRRSRPKCKGCVRFIASRSTL